jgi:coenzyme F420-reducing hydrogenase delta subunit
MVKVYGKRLPHTFFWFPQAEYMSDHPPRIYVFYCATSYEQGETMRGIDARGAEVKLVALPCSGKLDILYLTKAFETDADGVAVMMCKEGECRYLEGNLRAKKRIEAVDGLLEETGLGSGRVAFIQMGEGGVARVIRDVNEFCSRIKAGKEIVMNAGAR